jgi:hypothetical protein
VSGDEWVLVRESLYQEIIETIPIVAITTLSWTIKHEASRIAASLEFVALAVEAIFS